MVYHDRRRQSLSPYFLPENYTLVFKARFSVVNRNYYFTLWRIYQILFGNEHTIAKNVTISNTLKSVQLIHNIVAVKTRFSVVNSISYFTL